MVAGDVNDDNHFVCILSQKFEVESYFLTVSQGAY